jgi:hypothetical protein
VAGGSTAAARPFLSDEEAAEESAAARDRRAAAAARRARERDRGDADVVPASVSTLRAAQGPTKKAARQAEQERWAADEAAAGQAASGAGPAAVPSASRTARSSTSSPGSSASVGGVTVADASGFMLALVAWCWIGLPYLKGGPVAVKDVWRAKFLNKGPDGQELL